MGALGFAQCAFAVELTPRGCVCSLTITTCSHWSRLCRSCLLCPLCGPCVCAARSVLCGSCVTSARRYLERNPVAAGDQVAYRAAVRAALPRLTQIDATEMM